MKTILIILYVLYILACTTAGETSSTQKDCLTRFEKLIQTEWKYSNEKGYYELGDTLKSEIDKKLFPCLRGMDTSYVTKLFGSNHRSISKEYPPGEKDSIKAYFEYPISPSLDYYQSKGYKTASAFTLYISFNYNSKVIKMIIHETEYDSVP